MSHTARKHEQAQDAARFEDLVSQHLTMQASFPAYRVMVEHFDKLVANQDRDWDKGTRDDFDYNRGKKAGIAECRNYLRSFLKAKVDA